MSQSRTGTGKPFVRCHRTERPVGRCSCVDCRPTCVQGSNIRDIVAALACVENIISVDSSR
eukprot:scaffold322826_cov25-Prasinocladus_malaysianus.AAC.2